MGQKLHPSQVLNWRGPTVRKASTPTVNFRSDPLRSRQVTRLAPGTGAGRASEAEEARWALNASEWQDSAGWRTGFGRLVTGTGGGRMSASGSGGRSGRTTARTARRGTTCRTITPGRAPTDGAR